MSMDQKITLVCAFRTGSMLGREDETGWEWGKGGRERILHKPKSLEETLQRGSKSPMSP